MVFHLPDIVEHLLRHLVYSSFDGTGQSAASDDGIEPDGYAGSQQLVDDKLLAEFKLIHAFLELLQVFGTMGYVTGHDDVLIVVDGYLR
jgi:hypothetical protein